MTTALDQQVGEPTLLEPDTEHWRERASCKDDPQPDRWVDLPTVRVHGKNNPAYDSHLAELSAVCNACPVRVECLTEALVSNVRGVFAATDEYMRADLREGMSMPAPPLMPPPENDEDARLIEQQFTALRFARKGLSNNQIAQALNVSAMTVSRLLASEERPAVRRTNKPLDPSSPQPTVL